MKFNIARSILALLGVGLLQTGAAHDVIIDCGAIAREGLQKPTVHEETLNAAAFNKCFEKANNDPVDRVVHVPEGVVISSFGFGGSNLKNISL